MKNIINMQDHFDVPNTNQDDVECACSLYNVGRNFITIQGM